MSIVLNLSENWNSIAADKAVQLLGCIHDLEQHQNALAAVENIEAWAEKLKELAGFFSLVKHEGNTVCAAVDHIRSRPLFYAVNQQGFYLSDSAEWVRQQVNDTVMDEFAKAEFQLTGYVTGRDTLYKNVKQLQAGECLFYADHTLAVERYYSFEHSEPVDYSEAALLAELDVVAKASIQRLIHYANGRQIVIPLSGGYDSRLIAALLKEANYDNILTFTYGAKGNKEAAYSKIVADNLGLKWRFVEYTEALWQAAWQTDERKRYQLEGSNWSSLAHMQDWLAVKIMKEQGMVESDAVFAPGHSGDMVAGSHIPSFIRADLTVKYTKQELVEHLFNKHYCLTKHDNVQFSVNRFKEEIEKSLVLQAAYTAQEFANECEKHNWQNRQSKFIFNSVRVYEFFDYDWWIPLWDKEFVRFFEKLPLPLRNHKWYVEYVQSVYKKFSTDGTIDNAADAGILKRFYNLKILRLLGVRNYMRRLYRLIFKPKYILLLEPNYDLETIKRLEKNGYSLNGRLVYFFIKEIESIF